MELNQNQYYQLEFPVNDDAGQPIAAVSAATFTMIVSGSEVFQQDLCDGGDFSAGIFTVTLDSLVTVNFNRSYAFEVWVIVDGKNYLTHSGTIKFRKTIERIEPC